MINKNAIKITADETFSEKAPVKNPRITKRTATKGFFIVFPFTKRSTNGYKNKSAKTDAQR